MCVTVKLVKVCHNCAASTALALSTAHDVGTFVVIAGLLTPVSMATDELWSAVEQVGVVYWAIHTLHVHNSSVVAQQDTHV